MSAVKQKIVGLIHWWIQLTPIRHRHWCEIDPKGCGMSEKIRKTVAAVADVVLAYRPKNKQPKPRKRKKVKRG